MKDPSEEATSKFPRKLARDISFAMAIGRDSPMDPFTGRDLTLLFSKNKGSSAGLMYFAEKPLRKTPAFAIPRAGLAKAVNYKEPPPPAMLNPKVPQKVQNVPFTKAPRFPGEWKPTPQAQIKAARIEKDEQFRRAQTPGDERSVLQKIAPPGAPNLGKQAGRPWITPAPKRVPLYTAFWETTGEKKKKKEETKPAAGAVDANTSQQAITAPVPTDSQPASPTSGVEEGSMRQQPAESPAGALDEEQWMRERKNVIARYGLVAGGTRKERLRRKPKPKGPDFAAGTSRSAPLNWQPRGKEISDLMYNSRQEPVTLKKTANISFGKYAKRSVETAPHMMVADNAMKLSNVLKFHELQQQRAKHSAFAVPDEERSKKVERPMTAADDFSSNTESVRAVASRTRKFQGTPDLAMYADRPDLPLEALFGGNYKALQRKAIRELVTEEMQSSFKSSEWDC